MSENTPSPPRPKNRRWIFVFVLFFLGGIGAAASMIGFVYYIQAKPVELEEAQKLWKAKGPKNYDLVYTKRLNVDPNVDKFEVKVRAGVVEEVKMNGRKLTRQSDDEPDPRIFHSMDRLLDDVERFMNIDQKPGAPKVFVTAIFEPDNGALRCYLRRVGGTSQRVEIHITLTPVE
jgi:Family of unknown function (DUF6174)